MIRIYRSRYKDIDAVSVETDKLHMKVLPEHGCKTASVVDRASGYELLEQARGEKYLCLTPEGSYVSSECSGFDDLFPTIDPVVGESGSRKGILYNCHGEVCRVSHSYVITEEALETEFVSGRLGYTYKKRFSEENDGGIIISYEIFNNTDDDWECLWGGHIMLHATEGGYGIFPFPDGTEAEIMFADNRSDISRGDIISVTKELRSSQPFSKDGSAYKYYYSEKLSKGHVGYYNTELRKTVEITFDEKKIPYVGVWINNGSFKGMYNYAIEPCTLAYDTPYEAVKCGQSFSIPGNGKTEFSLELNLT